MHLYEVGKPYSPTRTQWEEGTEYNYRGERRGVHEIRLFFRHPKPIEVQSVKQGEATFGLVVQENLIVLVFKFGAIPWSDAPYSWHMVPERERHLPPELRPGERETLTVFLIDADTGILLAIRQVSFSPEFTRALHQAIRAQAGRPFDQVIYDRQLRALQARYQSKDLYKIAIVRCKGGD